MLGNESSKTNLTVFPNPAVDRILINSSGAPVRFIELIDIKGRVIYKGEMSGDTFNLSEFEKGRYILRLYDANKKMLNTKNIVKW
ncbi:T9SS type A sorting domain-containing protein [Emticicia sp. C21]|uniref:T9SS type A sorting domain-containing protein n=1 Tax=Emticicia sp. C21 TaxID=2302915 RepID=UPI000E34CD3E|nr:T9SS C-terminal target domain-containing protein [Emticicia sp. C21]